MTARRFRVQDLAQPSISPQSRPVDGFVNFAQAPPNFNDEVINFRPLAGAIVGQVNAIKEQDKADARREGLEFAQQNEELLLEVRQQLDLAVEGLTDRGDIAKAQKEALRRMAEAGLVPPQTNPAFLIGLAEGEAQRKLLQARNNLKGQIDRYSVLSDENDDLVDAPDPQDAIDAEFEAILGSALVRNSRIAREMIAEARPGIEGEFHAAVSSQRLAKQEDRARGLRGVEFIEGTERDGKTFLGIQSLADPTADGEITRASLQELMEHYRERGVPNVGEEFVSSLTAWANRTMQINPAEVTRALSRVGDLELTPGVPIDTDTRQWVQVIHTLRERANNALEDRSLKAARFNQVLDEGISRVYRGLFVQAMGDDPQALPDELHAAVMATMQEDPQFLALMDGADVTEIPAFIQGKLENYSVTAFESGLEQLDARDSAHIALYNRLRANGTPEDQALAILGTEASPAVLNRLEQGEDGTLDQLKGAPGWAELEALRTLAPDNISIDQARGVRRLQTNFDTALQALASEGLAEGKTAAQVLASPAVTQLRQRMEAEVDSLVKPVEDGTREFLAALSNNDLSKADEIMGTLRPQLSADRVLALDKERSRRGELLLNTLNNNPVYISTMNALERQVSLIAEDRGLDRTDTSALVSKIKNRFLRQTSGGVGAAIQGRTGVDKFEGIADLVDQALESSFEGLVTDEERKRAETIADDLPGFTKFTEADDRQKDYAATGSLTAALPDLPPILADTGQVISFYENNTLAKRRSRVLARLGSGVFEELSSPTAPPAETRIAALIRNAGIGGSFTPEDILNGQAELRVPIDAVTASNAARDAGFFGRRDSQEYADFLASRGMSLTLNPDYEPTGRPRLPFAFVTFKAEIKDPHPSLTLLFQSRNELDQWMAETPDETRAQLYKKLGIVEADLEKADDLFQRYQTTRIDRY